MTQQGKGAERQTDKEKIREDKLTVKPIRFQLEQPKHSLKKTFNIEIKSTNVTPLETQIAGHGSENDGQRGMLMHQSGFVLKPVQGPPKGEREVSFYQKISTSEHPIDKELVRLTAKFYGTESVKVHNGVVGLCDYLVLENLTQGLTYPCVMDVKIGARTYGPDASETKREQEDAKYKGTKVPFGFSVLGIISHSQSGVKRLHKSFGRNLSEQNIHEVLENFVCHPPEQAKLVAQTFLHKLEEFTKFFDQQTRYHIYASSLLFVYDSAFLEKDDKQGFVNSARLKLIDFAHVFPGEDQLDQNFIFGLKNLSNLFRLFLEKILH